MRVWNRTNILTGMILLLVCITACSKTDNVQPENNAAAEPQAEEMPVQAEESGIELPEENEAQDGMVTDNGGQTAKKKDSVK